MVVGDGNRCWFSNAMDRRLLVRPPGPGDACDVRDGGVMGSAAADVTGGDIRHIIDVEGRTWGWRFASARVCHSTSSACCWRTCFTMVRSTTIVRASDALPLAASVDDEQVCIATSIRRCWARTSPTQTHYGVCCVPPI